MIRGVAPLTMIALLILAGGSALVLTLTIAEFAQEGGPAPPAAEWTPKLSAPAEGPVSHPPLSAYPQTAARPVFFKSRRPFVAPPPAAPPRAPPPPPLAAVQPPAPPPPVVDPGLAVGGVMIGGEVKKAYVFRKGERAGSWLAEGEEIMGWKVQVIDSGGARLQKDGRSVGLSLYGT